MLKGYGLVDLKMSGFKFGFDVSKIPQLFDFKFHWNVYDKES